MDVADNKIQSVEDLLTILKESGIANKKHAHIRTWFRGQSRSGLELKPGVYRKNFEKISESERLEHERHMSQDFKVESAGLLTGRETDTELYFLQQHYRMPTRLLDWTNSPLAALHFAVMENMDSDADLFMMDAYRLVPCQKPGVKELEKFGIVTGKDPIVERVLDIVFLGSKDGEKPNFPDYIFPIRPPQLDRRISLQRSCFTLHVPVPFTLTRKENSTLLSFLIAKEAKQKIHSELSLLGIDEFGIYGDLEGLSKRLKDVYKYK
ncbi:MAG: FRG domain-containing protein [Desulfobaccales bacterium]